MLKISSGVQTISTNWRSSWYQFQNSMEPDPEPDEISTQASGSQHVEEALKSSQPYHSNECGTHYRNGNNRREKCI